MVLIPRRYEPATNFLLRSALLRAQQCRTHTGEDSSCIAAATAQLDALRTALLAFNEFDDTDRHRERMRLILQTEALQAYSMTMYAGWRAVVAAFVAARLNCSAADLVPQTVAWTMLGVALAAYENWLANDAVALSAALGNAFDTLAAGL